MVTKSNIDLVNDCDQLSYDLKDTSAFYKFKMQGYEGFFGYMLKDIVMSFTWPGFWNIDHNAQSVELSGSTLEERNARLQSTLRAEHEKGTFQILRKWTGELFPVYGPGRNLVLSMERSAAPLFGIVTYGVQLLAYCEVDNEISIWIAKRAKTKSTFPGMLDSTVGGSLPTGETPSNCLFREAEEEASFPQSLTRDLAKSCGTLNYVNITDERAGGELGLLRPEVQYLYEMRLPQDITPVPGDNEAESIRLFTVPQLKDALSQGEFTPANGCVVLGFFIRHGIVTAENEENYIGIASRLCRRHNYYTA